MPTHAQDAAQAVELQDQAALDAPGTIRLPFSVPPMSDRRIGYLSELRQSENTDENSFVSDERILDALVDMLTRNPDLWSVGVAKLREILYENAKIRVSVKRLRSLRVQAVHDPSASGAVPCSDGSVDNEAQHDLHKHYPAQDRAIHVVQSIWRASPQGRNMPFNEFHSAMQRLCHGSWSLSQRRKLGDAVRAMMMGIVVSQASPDWKVPNWDDMWIDIYRTSDKGQWSGLAVRKDFVVYDFIDEGNGKEVRVVPTMKHVIETGRRFSRDPATKEWMLVMPPEIK